MNKKGFALIETLVVVAFLITIFTFVYVSIMPLSGNYEELINRKEDINIVYKLYNIRRFMQNDINRFNLYNDNVRELKCSDFSDTDYCNNLMKSLDLVNYKLIYTYSIKNNYDALKNINSDIEEYIADYKNEDKQTLILLDMNNHTIVHLKHIGRIIKVNKPDNSNCKTNLVYNGTVQDLVDDNVAYTWISGKTRQNAGSQNVVAQLNDGYVWNDNSRSNLSINCSISKFTPTLTLSKSSISIYETGNVSFNESSNINGSFSNTNSNTAYASITGGTFSNVAAGTVKTVNVTGISKGDSIITISFTPTDTVNYNPVSATINSSVYRNIMSGSFPTAILNTKTTITEAYFINDTIENIDSRYNASATKGSVTYDGNGNVRAWLEGTKLYVGGYGKIYLDEGSNYRTACNGGTIATCVSGNNHLGLFEGFTKLKKINFANLDTTNVTSFYHFFKDCSSLNSIVNLNNLSIGNATYLNGMFFGCSSFTSLNLSNWTTTKAVDMNSMFRGCTSLKSVDLRNLSTPYLNNMFGFFNGCSSLTSFNLSSINTSKVTNMTSMFDGCSSITTINLSNFNTSSLEGDGFRKVFFNCSSLTSVNLSGFNTSKVTSLFGLFEGCTSIKKIDISSFNTAKVSNMREMFQGCANLETIYVGSGWTIGGIKDAKEGKDVFAGCSTKLKGAATWQSNKIDYKNATTSRYLTLK